MPFEITDYQAALLDQTFYYIDPVNITIKKGISKMIIQKSYIDETGEPTATVEFLIESDDTTELVDNEFVYDNFADAAAELETLLDS